MTDTANGLAVLDRPPDVSGPSSDGLICPEPNCSYVAPGGPMAAARLGVHRRAKHGVIGANEKKAKGSAKAKAPAKAPAAKAAPSTASSTTAPARQKRHSLAGTLGSAWGFLAGTFGPGRPGFVMAWAAPAAGPVLDNAVAGTSLDRRLLQRLAGGSERWSDLGSLLVLPMVAALVEKQPAARDNPQVLEVATQAILRIVDRQLDADIAHNIELERLERKAREAGRDDLRSTIDDLLALLFGMPTQPAGPAV